MSSEWLIWYGIHIGLTLNETLDLPIGELLTLIAIDQIKSGIATEKEKYESEEDEFFALLNRR